MIRRRIDIFGLHVAVHHGLHRQARIDTQRVTADAVAWLIGPALGVSLYGHAHPAAGYSMSAAAAMLMVVYFWRPDTRVGGSRHTRRTVLDFLPAAGAGAFRVRCQRQSPSAAHVSPGSR